MPHNPERSERGGDVEGVTKTDVDHAVGSPVEIAKASFDPGYSLDTTLSDAGTVVNKADMLQGYCSYGKTIGERSNKE